MILDYGGCNYMAYSKTLACSKKSAIVQVTGWTSPALALSQEYIKEVLDQLSLIEDDMISSKEGLAGEAIHSLQQNLKAMLGGCIDYNE